MRGGVSYLVQIYGKAKNEQIKFCDKNKSSNCIIYKDASNLYVWSISEGHSVGRFELIDAERIDLNELF